LHEIINARIVGVLRHPGDNPMKKLPMSIRSANLNKPYTSCKGRDAGLFMRDERHDLATVFQ
jgi:hypothetical protein